MFIVKFTGSPHYPRGKRYLEEGPMRMVQGNRRYATRFETREQAEQAMKGSWPNGWKPHVEEA